MNPMRLIKENPKDSSVMGKGQAYPRHTSRALSTTTSRHYIKKMAESLRFLHAPSQQNYPALMVGATNDQGKVQAVQLIFLDRNTGQKISARLNKMTLGRLKFGASVKFNQGQGHAYIAEGPETALSILAAKPNSEVVAVLSQSNYQMKDGKPATFCFDNDDKPLDAKVLFERIEQLKNPKIDWVMPDKAKTDFNDVLRQQGVNAVANLIDKNAKPLDSAAIQNEQKYRDSLEALFTKTNPKQEKFDAVFKEPFLDKNADNMHNYAKSQLIAINFEKEI